MSNSLKVYSEELDSYKDSIISENIYFNNHIFLKKNSVLTDAIINIIKEKSINFIYVLNSKHIINSIDFEIRYEVKNTVKNYIDLLFNKYSYNNKNDTKLMKKLINLFFNDIMKDKYIVDYLQNSLLISRNLYEHIIRVSILSIVLAVKSNIPRKMIKEIGIGALLHELGKVRLIIENPSLKKSLKNGEYTQDELLLIRTHPVIGYELINDNKEIPIESKKIILFHNVWDNFESSYSKSDDCFISYPSEYNNKPITSKNKDIGVRIVQTANFYDMFVDKFNNTEIALKIISSSTFIFGDEIANILLNYISPYEIGENILLSDKKQYKVVEHTNNNLRPIVCNEITHKTINLNKNSELNIVKSLDKKEVNLNESKRSLKNYYYL